MSKIFPFLLIVSLLSSCASVYYPSHINSSFIEEKGETNVGGALSLSSVNVQASTALSKHLRLAGGINYWGWSVSIGNSSIGSSGLQAQLLTGYYTKIGKNVFFEGYGGLGTSFGDEDMFGHVIIQPSIGFGKESPTFIMSVRANYLNNSIFSDPNSGAILGPGETNKITGMFYDYGLTHRFLKEKTTWSIQYGVSRDIEKFGDTELIPFMNVGLNLRLFSKNYIKVTN